METVFICPTDFSECSLNALEFASRLGESYQAKLVILHVLNRKDYLKLSPNDTAGKYQAEFIHEKLLNLQVAVEEESLSKGLKSCEIMMVEGDIFDGIDETSERLGADMIIMGTEGMNDRRDLVLGSRASRMVEKSKVDVLIIPRSVFFRPFRKIIYASDYLEEDKLAIQKTIEMAKFFDSDVNLVHWEQKITDLKKSLFITVEEELKPFINYQKAKTELKPYSNDLADAIENYLEEEEGDLLVTYSLRKGFFEKLFTKSLSKKMAYFTHKPLWVIKSF